MIIVGYQGIGKSTLAKKHNGFIDLESSNFWVHRKRDANWHIIYCSIANHLSEQGYHVFMSSHAVVRKELRKYATIKYIVCPSIKLEDEWVAKLKKRYDDTRLEKDFKAWRNAAERYHENVTELLSDNEFNHILIVDMAYDLETELRSML